TGYAARKPHQLSGGQQTRVALARALAIRPAIVLLDEPFSNLDHALRAEVSGEVVSLLKKSKTTSLMVTHDREDALVSADLIALMRDGQVVQSGTPEGVYMDPVSADIAESTGDILELPARRLMKKRAKLLSPLHLVTGKTSGEIEAGSILIRPEEIRVHEKKAGLPTAKITQINYYGHDAVLELALPGYSKEIKVRVTGPLQFEVGKTVALEHVGPIRWVSKKPTGE
ncbi:MAG: ABC transporter ATP-binding protein, partial [Actinomycetota bacterium]